MVPREPAAHSTGEHQVGSGNGRLMTDFSRDSITSDTLYSMQRRSSPVVRAAHALVAVVTIWCLGCSGYEPLLGSLLGTTDAMMMCDSAPSMREDMGAGSMSGIGAADHGATVSASASAERGFDCGCGSCHAASASTATAMASHRPIPALPHAEPTAPSSISRAPLLPPPEFTA